MGCSRDPSRVPRPPSRFPGHSVQGASDTHLGFPNTQVSNRGGINKWPPAPSPQPPHSVHRASVHRFPISCASFRLRAVTFPRTAQHRHVRPRRRFQKFANRQRQRHKQQADTGTQRQTVTDTDSATQTRTHREDTRRNRHTGTGTGYSSNPSHRRGAAATLPPPELDATIVISWPQLVPTSIRSHTRVRQTV